MEICHRYLRYNCCNKTTRCNNHKKSNLSKVIKQLIFQPFKLLMILCKQEYTTMKKELETKARVKNKIATKKECIIDLQQPLFLCQVKAILL